MGRNCASSHHRASLLASDVAVCYYCFAAFPPDTISKWCDGENHDQTAICPHCEVDAVVGFTGPVDWAWVQAAHTGGFS